MWYGAEENSTPNISKLNNNNNKNYCPKEKPNHRTT